ncbi:MAG: N-acetylmuramoyl-L-alanine amidase [Bacteroidales bacterium]|nr:N-acetylmuramoyl-L-alanine amidase [Candidatus Scybalocola fimicaballi]
MDMCISASAQKTDGSINSSLDTVFTWFRNENFPTLKFGTLKMENYSASLKDSLIQISLSKPFKNVNYREDAIRALKDSISKYLPAPYTNFDVELYISSRNIYDYVPNSMRKETKKDNSRILHLKNRDENEPKNVVTKVGSPCTPSAGLQGRNVALWASHGYYFEPSQNLWILQRPRLFGISEDTYTPSIVLPYLIPMLENAGANVFYPRERDVQKNEVIVDYETAKESEYVEENARRAKWQYPEADRKTDTTGYAQKKKIYRHGDNPFADGSYRVIRSHPSGSAYTDWIPEIPEEGEYAVYISYKSLPKSTNEAHYTVYHTGGESEFIVDQTMGGGTWIYLGTFKFKGGSNPEIGKVRLTSQSEEKGKLITADAVKFGGGVGCVERSITPVEGAPEPFYYTSEKPKYLECARYWLQMAGFSDSVYCGQSNEYKTDYMSRAIWVNALSGGSHLNTKTKGKKIPIDLALALHTDAGIDSLTIGTLAIFLTSDMGKTEYPTGLSRMASRDFADMVQTQVVDDIKKLYCPDWHNRGLRDEAYYEARVPEVPTMLLELLSHQNFEDMKYAHDPEFKFTVARSIYKAAMKFIAGINNIEDYEFTPLAPSHFAIDFNGDKISLSWQPTKDSLEPSVKTDGYILYTAIGDNGFNNGVYLEENKYSMELQKDSIYRFKVTAVNRGGESFPTEILSASIASKEKGRVLIVNGFNRVSGPEFYEDSLMGGFIDSNDPGVPYIRDISKTGSQTDFKKGSPYISNDQAGFGACDKNLEGQIIAGNTFNYPYIHGKALHSLGFSFVSMSDEAFESHSNVDRTHYCMVDYILGMEKETKCGMQKRYNVFNFPTRKKISKYLLSGGNLFVSGAYLMSELELTKIEYPSVAKFAHEVLGAKLKSATAEDGMQLSQIQSSFSIKNDFKHSYKFNHGPSDRQYTVASPNILDKGNANAFVVFRYLENGEPAAVGQKGKLNTLISAVPFESIDEDEQETFMKELATFFGLIGDKNKTANSKSAAKKSNQAKKKPAAKKTTQKKTTK